jgi:iron complex outermembrane receptor protein
MNISVLFSTVFVANPSHANTDDNLIETQNLTTIEVIGKNTQSNNNPNLSNQEINNNIQNKQTNPLVNANTINNKKIANIQATTLADVAKLDASLNQNYAPLGYQENFSLRGLPLNLDASYLINGIPSSHRQIPNLANKEQIEVLKGVDALESNNTSSGGAINYVTKRAKNIKQIHSYAQGSGEYGFGLDVGKIYNNIDNYSIQNDKSSNYYGYRFNLDYANLKPYVKTATGEKYLASIALDGKQDKFIWQVDADYQSHRQYSVPGYQLLGGTDIPQNVEPETMLNNASWRKPVYTKSYNLGTKLKYEFSSNLNVQANLQHIKVNIDDYVAFPYSFKSNGNYKLADYQSLNQTYKNNYAELSINSIFNTYNIKHNLGIGYAFLEFVRQGSDSVSMGKEVRNIYNPEQIITPYASTGNNIGDKYTQIKHQQNSIFIKDVLSIYNSKLFLGGRFSFIDEKSFSGSSTPIGQEKSHINMYKFLPNIGLVHNWDNNFSSYIKYAKNIEIGRDKDVLDYNSSYLAPRISKQSELGFNYNDKDLNIKTAMFDISRPFEYLDTNSYQFVQNGKEKRQGIELNFSHRWQNLNYGLSSTYYIKATKTNTNIASYNNANAVNVPKFQTNLWLDYNVQAINGLSIGTSIYHTNSKAVTKDASVKVPSYTTVDLGLKYTKNINSNYISSMNMRFGIDNIFNKKYWKDAGEAFGESYIHLGSPRVYKASMSFDFK